MRGSAHFGHFAGTTDVRPQMWHISRFTLRWNVSATEVSGEARIFMFTLIHQERDPQGRLLEPLPVAAIELNEQPGLRYLATIVNCPTDQIAVDMPVRLVWTERDGLAWPAFEPADRR